MKHHHLVKEVDRILWEEWDPIGVNTIEEIRDEYSSYAPTIAKMILDGADVTTLRKHLFDLANLTIGVSTQEMNHHEFAKILGNLVFKKINE